MFTVTFLNELIFMLIGFVAAFTLRIIKFITAAIWNSFQLRRYKRQDPRNA